MKVVALSGGVGGARLVEGLGAVLPPGDLTVVVNTGDDFVHWGLNICPDLDTVMYTLAGLAHPEQGWGLAGETFHAFAMVERYGGEAWFRLGDRDLATHLTRTQAARRRTLPPRSPRSCAAGSASPTACCRCRTRRARRIDTADGTLSFQEWLVRRAPPCRQAGLVGRLAPARARRPRRDRRRRPRRDRSVEPVRVDRSDPRARRRAPALAAKTVVAVSPIVGGKAVKGPLAGMIETLAGRPASCAAVRDHYGDLLRAFVIEKGDDAPDDLAVHHTSTVMPEASSRARLAREVLAFARGLA